LAMTSKLDVLRPKIEAEEEAWVTTFRPDGSQARVPVWFALGRSKVYILTDRSTKKAANLRRDRRVELAFGSRESRRRLKGRAGLSRSRSRVAWFMKQVWAKYGKPYRRWVKGMEDYAYDTGVLIIVTPE
ncbi:MAG: pyridoxamine 5'-phosphate oxidase family protein, partial [Chloroflexi bacterium]|nr:pyridoxamine 5'-phosphate oxidase family protein [Chloroflexota bacterium]